MFITDKNVFIRNEETDGIIKGINVDIFHYCSINKSYIQHRINDGTWISRVPSTPLIVPRVSMSRGSYNLVTLCTLKDNVRLIEWVNNVDTECSDCPYSENCNGQMCFFAEV